jgi:hypothetical protein
VALFKENNSMTRRAAPPFRADHVGSLLRPPALLAARDDFAAGRIDAAALAAVEDDAIRDAVQLQEDAGLRSATDGEFRRYLQFDDTIFAFLNDPAWRANATASGLHPDHQHEINVDVINEAVRVRVHGRGQRAHHRRRAGQARPAGGDRRRDLGLRT